MGKEGEGKGEGTGERVTLAGRTWGRRRKRRKEGVRGKKGRGNG